MKNIIIINFTDQILSLNSQIKIDQYPNFEKTLIKKFNLDDQLDF